MTDALEIAQSLMANRLAIVEKVAQLNQEALNAAEALRAVQREQAAAWSEAVRAGWSETELRKMGLTKPTGQRGRPRGESRKNDTSRTSETVTSSDSETY